MVMIYFIRVFKDKETQAIAKILKAIIRIKIVQDFSCPSFKCHSNPPPSFIDANSK